MNTLIRDGDTVLGTHKSGSTISALVAQALTEFLARGQGSPRRR